MTGSAFYNVVGRILAMAVTPVTRQFPIEGLGPERMAEQGDRERAES